MEGFADMHGRWAALVDAHPMRAEFSTAAAYRAAVRQHTRAFAAFWRELERRAQLAGHLCPALAAAQCGAAWRAAAEAAGADTFAAVRRNAV